MLLQSAQSRTLVLIGWHIAQGCKVLERELTKLSAVVTPAMFEYYTKVLPPATLLNPAMLPGAPLCGNIRATLAAKNIDAWRMDSHTEVSLPRGQLQQLEQTHHFRTTHHGQSGLRIELTARAGGE